jgi:hypothetical protein
MIATYTFHRSATPFSSTPSRIGLLKFEESLRIEEL